MSLIDRAATFRGNIVDHAVSVSRNEFPQFVCSLVAKEIYDEEEQIWVDWTDVDQNEITAYVILYGSKGETLSFNQIKKVLGWDGASFQVLNDGDYSEVGIQFRVVEDTYDNKPQIKVEWVDEYNAEPGRAVRKLDPDELKQLDAKYAQLLKASGKKVAPVKASGTNAGTVKAKDIKSTSPKGPVTKKPKNSPKNPSEETTSTLPPTVPNALPGGHCTKQEAWDEIVELRDKKVTDEQLAKSWVNAIKEVGGDKQPEEFTDEEYFQVKEKVMSETAVF